MLHYNQKNYNIKYRLILLATALIIMLHSVWRNSIYQNIGCYYKRHFILCFKISNSWQNKGMHKVKILKNFKPFYINKKDLKHAKYNIKQ